MSKQLLDDAGLKSNERWDAAKKEDSKLSIVAKRGQENRDLSETAKPASVSITKDLTQLVGLKLQGFLNEEEFTRAKHLSLCMVRD